MFRNIKIILAVIAIIIVAAGAYAFAAQNTVPDSAVGYKANVVPGYTVTNIVYDLVDTDPTTINEITFTISPTSGTVPAALVEIQTSATALWTDTPCTLVAGVAPAMNVTCTPTGTLNVVDITALNIVASSSANPAD